MSIDYKLLGERIKIQRLSKGTTQEHFAEHMNVSVGYISQMERGITKISLERLAAISEYLDCDMALLLEGVNSNNDSYLAKDFDLLYNQLSAYEKKILTLLLKEYIENRK
ncbi:helix-turn-helix domain-containing protein [Schaedlerella arabinosiphila]|jgi:transcriptional regulator with XRE-family HTH domain|uniref:helix-turn-helix domain-containing protein n=1 Tax=Schaedlerella arabinosiphila TaxID=2044587 RepID=UPI002557FBFE|nr:helix-turn-helix transcriptional regulator [Schaedlerella arabinosiphila]